MAHDIQRSVTRVVKGKGPHVEGSEGPFQGVLFKARSGNVPLPKQGEVRGHRGYNQYSEEVGIFGIIYVRGKKESYNVNI